MLFDTIPHASHTNMSAISTLRTKKWTPWQTVPPGPESIDNGAHGTEKLLLKIQVSEDFA